MYFQLPTGKTIEITFDQWLEMTDEDIKEIIARDCGEDIGSPWKNSALERVDKKNTDSDYLEDPKDEEIPNEDTED